MIILAVLLLGLLAPFVFIYGWLLYLIVLPFGAVFVFAKPHWQRIPKHHRSLITKALIVSASATVWIAMIRANT